MLGRFCLLLVILFLCPISYVFGEDYTFTGEIEGKVKVSAISQDWGSITWLIENGTVVKKGTVVAKMDPKRTQERLDGSKDDLDRLNEELKNNQKELEEAFKEEDVAISQCVLERDLAKVKWEIAKSGIYGIELSRIQNEIINAEIELDKKKLAFTISKALFEKELEEAQAFQQKKLDLETAEIEVELKKINLAIKQRDKSNLEKISKMELDVKEIQLQKAEKNKLNRTQKIKFDIQKKEENLINLNDSIKKNELRLANLTLSAPVDGIAKHRFNQGKLIQVGDRTSKGYAVIDILYGEKKKNIIKVDEKLILKFKINDVAKIKILDTGEVLSGAITRISNTPKDKNESLGPVGRRVSGYSGITIFEVEVSFDDPQSKYMFGFNTSVTFTK
jgi:multidrug resistance efflux pump